MYLVDKRYLVLEQQALMALRILIVLSSLSRFQI